MVSVPMSLTFRIIFLGIPGRSPHLNGNLIQYLASASPRSSPEDKDFHDIACFGLKEHKVVLNKLLVNCKCPACSVHNESKSWMLWMHMGQSASLCDRSAAPAWTMPTSSPHSCRLFQPANEQASALPCAQRRCRSSLAATPRGKPESPRGHPARTRH